jgi:hypothetical protein
MPKKKTENAEIFVEETSSELEIDEDVNLALEKDSDFKKR